MKKLNCEYLTRIVATATCDERYSECKISLAHSCACSWIENEWIVKDYVAVLVNLFSVVCRYHFCSLPKFETIYQLKVGRVL